MRANGIVGKDFLHVHRAVCEVRENVLLRFPLGGVGGEISQAV